MVSYCADPTFCLDWVRQNCTVNLLGNHDNASLSGDPIGFNRHARAAAIWTYEQLREAGGDRLDFLGALSSRHDADGCLLVHAAPSHPMNHYIGPDSELVGDPAYMGQNFDLAPKLTFCGHRHIAGICDEVTEAEKSEADDGSDEMAPDEAFLAPVPDDEKKPTRKFRFRYASEVDGSYTFNPDPTRKEIICIGAVGQPRDGDPSACYVIWEGDAIEFRRVAYDIPSAQVAIRAAGLPEYLAYRLELGQ